MPFTLKQIETVRSNLHFRLRFRSFFSFLVTTWQQQLCHYVAVVPQTSQSPRAVAQLFHSYCEMTLIVLSSALKECRDHWRASWLFRTIFHNAILQGCVVQIDALVAYIAAVQAVVGAKQRCVDNIVFVTNFLDLSTKTRMNRCE